MIFQPYIFNSPNLSGPLFFRVQRKKRNQTVIFLHGYLENGDIWLPWLNNLTFPAGIIIPDLPAHGRSAEVSTPADFIAWAEALWQFIGHQTQQPVSLIGHSMGGYLALEMARQHPQKVHRMVLFHSTPFPDRPHQRANRKRQIIHLQKGKKNLLIKDVGKTLFAPQNRPKHHDDALKIHQMAAQCTSPGMINCLKAIAQRPNYSETLRQFEKKTLLITGRHDPFMPPKYKDELINQYPHLQNLHLQNSAHCAFLEQPEITQDTVTRFLFQD